ncbi:response regulator transcription factor [Frankia sp. CNm7]|uniref:Response regulator transcription factor n=1 Tax=Frankia nepalensis TaxID=1836974 RepID=A0A937UN10_9ACTN|nr:response regulator transcription factor [Frankia nepalensis]MBL7496697.1 response regulator transcription factor [Frankia nepalensis]MBL7511073.1 response regulator transcription factor [Frankia nepalensis]MBL7516705.1 response regulator transcription factor [Frankia nepalensis]MBL7627437.1 response regulator transcription factor [Frankia nepalensis]
MRVLLVEDDEPLADAVARGLRRERFAVDVVHDGETALDKIGTVDYEIVVLDRNLPGIRGDAVCEQIVDGGRAARILMLTASADVSKRVEGLMLGADDYLPKPFDMRELVARLRALGRRSHRVSSPVLRWDDICLDAARRIARRGDRELGLTNREFALLETFMLADGAVLSAEQLMESVWDDRLDPFSNAVRVTVLTLRRKLGDPPVIVTVPSVGYRLV